MRLLIFLFVILLVGLIGCESKKDSKEKKSETDPKQAAILLLGKYGCLGCHTEDGNRLIGPTFKGIFGRKTKLSDQSEITSDENYLKTSILEPDAHIVDGYQKGLMPKMVLTEEEVELMVEYIKGL